jgi:hypothetical protein
MPAVPTEAWVFPMEVGAARIGKGPGMGRPPAHALPLEPPTSSYLSLQRALLLGWLRSFLDGQLPPLCTC